MLGKKDASRICIYYSHYCMMGTKRDIVEVLSSPDGNGVVVVW